MRDTTASSALWGRRIEESSLYAARIRKLLHMLIKEAANPRLTSIQGAHDIWALLMDRTAKRLI